METKNYCIYEGHKCRFLELSKSGKIAYCKYYDEIISSSVPTGGNLRKKPNCTRIFTLWDSILSYLKEFFTFS